MAMAAAQVVVFPFPLQGHINCMLKLAELLTMAGLNVTFLNTIHNDVRLRRFSATYARLADNPGFCFRSIPDGLLDDDPRSASRVFELWHAMETVPAVRETFREILLSQEGFPPVTCLISDGFMSFTFDVAEEVGVPAIAFRTSSACSFWCYVCIPKLIANNELPFVKEAEMDELMHGVPAMEGFLRRRDFPRFSANSVAGELPAIQILAQTACNANRAKGLILNTSECLEAPVLSQIRSVCRPVYSIGPLHVLHRSFVNPNIEFVSGSIWKEDRTCMDWLNAQPQRSVVYVSFGSLTTVDREVLFEFWYGLVNSGHKFLWVVRPDLIDAGTVGTATAPAELEKATKERGRMVEWVPQNEVLAHPAVGCFLTHSGWNSTLESIVAGVPMICWPFFADQQINSRFIEEVWEIGLDMKDQYDRKVVEKMVRDAMDGETAAKLKMNADKMAEKVRGSAEEGGTSYENFKKLVEHIRLLGNNPSPSLPQRTKFLKLRGIQGSKVILFVLILVDM